MPLETNLNVNPYYDDFNEEKKFHRILFTGNTAVQARELTQLQTILQNQIERFGDGVFKSGTIIKGCSFTYDSNYSYVKVLDNQVDGTSVTTASFANTAVKSSTGLTAFVVNTADGLQSQTPDLNTLYIKYQNSGSDGAKEFNPSDVLTAYSRNYSVQRVLINTAGNSYSNNDVLVFSSATGSGAQGKIVTNNTGQITGVLLQAGGTNYLTDPTVSITTSTGTGATLTAQTAIAQLTVAPNTYANSVGTGYAFKVSDGIIFQKGFFVNVDSQTVVVSKYSITPDSVAVGFITGESIITATADTSLYDPANGSSNNNAPGADRLKLQPTLVVVPTASAADTEKFFMLAEFQQGRVVKTRQGVQFNTIETELAKRTSEESGDYIVNPFNVFVDDISANTTHSQAKIGAGVAYVAGYRVEQPDSFAVVVRKGTDTKELKNVAVSQAIGNYTYIKNMQGTIPFNQAVAVNLQDTLNTGLAAQAGNTIGTAKVRSLVYDNGKPGDPTAQYRLYLFDIQMSSGKNFSDVKSVYYNGTLKGTADLVLDTTSKAVLQDTDFKLMVFPTGSKAIKTLRSASSSNDTNFIYSTVDTGVSFAANGTLQKTLTGETFPYSGTLDSVAERDFTFISQANTLAATALTGSIAYTNGANTVTGTGTSFLNDFVVGEWFQSGAGETKRVTAIANNTYLTVDSNFAAANTSTTYTRFYIAGGPINFTSKANRTITVSGSSMTATLGETIAAPMNVTAIYNVQRSSAVALTKNINKSVLVKINTSASNLLGPWSLGLPDILGLTKVTMTSNADYVTGAVDVTQHFVLDNGQREGHYGLASISKAPGSTLSITAGQYLVVTVDAFSYTSTGGGIGFFSIDSYPIDDATTPLPSNKIRTQDVPVFVSTRTNTAIDLRDAIDFRPVASATATLTATLASASINPSATEAYTASEKYFPAPGKVFSTSLQKYVGRYDKIVVDSEGNYTVVEGAISDTPIPPADVTGAMTLATLTIPPYPTLSLKAGTTANRPDYTATVKTNTNKRYTMSDIGKIDARVKQLEYYSALSMLEKQTKDLVIPSAVDPTLNTFKNGIYVEPFADWNLTNLTDGECTASIDTTKQELVPAFEQSMVELKVASTTTADVKDDIVQLPVGDKVYLSQPYASKQRQAAENHWDWQGNISLFRDYFNYYDIRYNPKYDWGGAGSVSSLNDNVYFRQGSISLTQTAGSINIYTDQNFINQIKLLVPQPTVDNTYSAFAPGPYNTGDVLRRIGDYMYVQGSPCVFSYEHVVLVKATGLKPNTRYYSKFDGVDVSQWVIGITEAIYNRDVANKYSFVHAGFGTPTVRTLTSDSTGTVFAGFFIPRGYFFTGSKVFQLLDDLTNPTSQAAILYNSFNYDDNKNPAVMTTRPVTSIDNTVVNASQLPSGTLPNTPFNVASPTYFGSTGSLTHVVLSTPLSQTFYISSQDTDSKEGLHATKLDLYFSKADPTYGVTMELRTVDNNGNPTSTVVPGSSVHLKASQVVTSLDGSLATTFQFASPVLLRSGFKYAIVVKPDGNSPEYSLWVGQNGQPDTLKPSMVCRQDWGDGELFIASNDSNWTAVQDEDLKFTLYRAQFGSLTGSVTVTNADEEYFSVSASTGQFLHGEPVFSFNSTYQLTGNVTITQDSVTLSGAGTTFLSQLQAGSIIHVANTVTPTASSGWISMTVESVANNTSATLTAAPNFTWGTVKAYQAPTGMASYWNNATSELYLSTSTAANTTFKFNANDTLIGTITGTQATIGTVKNLTVDYYQPLIYRTEVAGTSVTGTIQLSDTNLTLQAATPVKFNDANHVTAFQGVIGSRSNEIVAGGSKSLQMTMQLTSDNTIVSPTFDVRHSSILRFHNLINNDDTNEYTSNGNALSKYVSTSIVLANGQDAEAMNIWLDSYRPSGTEVEVYVRLLNGNDPDPLKSKVWHKMQLMGTARYSSTANLLDFAEYQYTLPATPATTVQAGAVATTTASAVVNGSGTTLTNLAVGDVVKINDAVNGRYWVTRILSIATATQATMTSTAPWNSTGATIERFNIQNAPYVNLQNSSTVEYFSSNGKFEKYKTYAIKVVLLAQQSNVVPRVADIRAVARTA